MCSKDLKYLPRLRCASKRVELDSSVSSPASLQKRVAAIHITHDDQKILAAYIAG